MVYTKEYIREKITTNDVWLYHAISAIYQRQTEGERASQTTHEYNSIGFNAFDAEILSSFAEQLKVKRVLSIKQKDLARKKMLKYAGQLTKIANKEI